jgi:hypothetical protein
MKHLLLPLCLLLAAFVRDTRDATACGGPYTFHPKVVGPPALFFDEYEDSPTAEQTFLYPYFSAYPREADVLWRYSYGSLASVPAPDSSGFESALVTRDVTQARKAARQLVDAWYALPPVLAAPHRATLMRAVDYLEPSGSAASQQLFDLIRAQKRDLGQGWSAGLQSPLLVDAGPRQVSDIRAWLKANPRHPLRDFARFWLVHTYYFTGDSDDAWAVLFELYPRRRVRALAEMRFLVMQGRPPGAKQLDALQDPLLLALFADRESTTPARYARWWKLSEKAANRPVGTALQERLLATLLANEKNPLPPSFPPQAERRSQYWGKLRALLLQQRGRTREAEQQLASLSPDPEQAALLANARVALGRPLDAVRAPQLGESDVTYLMHVGLSRGEAAKLAQDPNPNIAREARWVAALEQLAQADYLAAALLVKTLDPPQAKDLEQMAQRQRHGDELGLARLLRTRKQSLGPGVDTGFYRGLSEIYETRPPGSAEAQRIAALLRDSSGSFQALALLVKWLEQHPRAPNALGVLREADAAYIELGSYGTSASSFWERYLKQHDLAARLRRIGKQIRQATLHP